MTCYAFICMVDVIVMVRLCLQMSVSRSEDCNFSELSCSQILIGFLYTHTNKQSSVFRGRYRGTCSARPFRGVLMPDSPPDANAMRWEHCVCPIYRMYIKHGQTIRDVTHLKTFDAQMLRYGHRPSPQCAAVLMTSNSVTSQSISKPHILISNEI